MSDKKLNEEIKDCLDHMDVYEVEYIDDPDDCDNIEIVVTGRFKQDAFNGTWPPKKNKDAFDNAKPFEN